MQASACWRTGIGCPTPLPLGARCDPRPDGAIGSERLQLGRECSMSGSPLPCAIRSSAAQRPFPSAFQPIAATRQRPCVARPTTQGPPTAGRPNLCSVSAQLGGDWPARPTAGRLTLCSVAERVGFEPTVALPLHMISSHAPSATRSPLQAMPTQAASFASWHSASP